MIHEAACHCRACRAWLMTEMELKPRSCTCGFCRRHGAATFSDPHGRMQFASPNAYIYRFASGLTDYLICPTCGVYLGARMLIKGSWFGTLNLNYLDSRGAVLGPVAISYEGESIHEKMARRERHWTPIAEVWSENQ